MAAKGKKKLKPKDLEEALEALFNQSDRDTWSSCVHKVGAKGSADNAYAVCTAQLGAPDKKESSKRRNNKYVMNSRILESFAKDGDTRYLVTLIQEGLGNFKDTFYYPRECLEAAAKLFEGKKIYADHPSAFDEEVRPERSVRDVLGHFENVELVETDEGRAELQATLVVPMGEPYDWARAMCNHALTFKEKYNDKEFVGLSINASGDAEETPIDDVIKAAPEACKEKLLEAKGMGIDTVMVTTVITNATSTDLVTEAGAGGKILKLMEEAKSMGKPNKTSGKQRQADPPAEDHADADQDKDLFNKLISKHLSDSGDDEMDESERESCKEKYEAYKEMGMDEEEALKHAMAHHKMEKHMKQKKEAAEAASQPDPSKLQAEAHHEDDAPPPPSKKQESNRGVNKELIAVTGRLAAVEKELAKEKLSKFVDRKLAESKLPRSATKKFMALCEKEGFANEKDFTSKFAIFTESYGADRDSDVLVPNTEKFVHETDGAADFSDCVAE